MASSGNPNTPGGGGPLDMNVLFKPSTPTPPTPTSNPNPQNFLNNNYNYNTSNPNLVSAAFPPPSASYPPPAGGSGPYAFPPQATSPFHHHPAYAPYTQQDFPNVQPHRSMSYPTPPVQPQEHPPASTHHHLNFQTPSNSQNPNPGARLMALLSAPAGALPEIPQQPVATPTFPQIQPTSSAGSDFAVPQNLNMSPSGTSVVANQGPMMRMPSSKLPNGRHLAGDHLVYDIDVKLPGEVQPQLEVTPITKYGSDPGLVVGRQIAVNKSYICYGLKLGAIRVLNINTALRSLLKGLAQRVTDMAFFAEDVHLLASASVDGRVYVWKITEGPDEEDKPQITGRIVTALKINGEGEPVHPRVCWHCHKQEVLVVGIGRHVLKIDTTKVGRGQKFSAEEPLRCPIDKLIDGVQLVGSHDGEVTDLSMCQWMMTRLVSASVDGTIKIWEDRKSLPIAVLRPYDGQPVNSVTFLAAPHQPDHIILITGGPLNREIKIWVSTSEEGWLLPSDAESWKCTQVLELKSSDSQPEKAFFNQVVALSQAGLLLLANAKRNAIYTVHLEYGPNPAATRMDYLSEFTVTLPILSFTGTSELLPHGDQTVQVYCVQTQAIQQYALDLSRCLPPPIENVAYERSESSVSLSATSNEVFSNVETSVSKPTEISVSSSAPKASINVSTESPTVQEFAASSVGSKTDPLSKVVTDSDVSSVTSPPSASSPSVEYSVYRQMDVASPDNGSRNDDNELPQNVSAPLKSPIEFKHSTHLVTPSEMLMANSTPEANNHNEREREGKVNNHDTRNVVVDVNVVGETRTGLDNNIGSQEDINTTALENKEKIFCSQASDLGMEMAREFHASTPETYIVEEATRFNGNCVSEEMDDSAKDVSGKVVDSSVSVSAQQQSGPSIALPSGTSDGAAFQRISSMQDMLNQLVTMQKELQKDLATMVAAPVTKESKRVEAALGRSMERVVKANSDALWARIQEEYAKREKATREHTQQITNMINNGLNKDLPSAIEKMVKKELTTIGQSVARSITPGIEKTISTSIAESFQRGIGDKAINQVDKSINSKLESSVARQIQAQFQTSGKQILQETLKSSLESSVIPAFETSCRVMFEQVDSAFKKGMVEHSAAAQQQFEASHSPLTHALRDAINSASSVTQTLSTDLLEGQRKFLALAANSNITNPLISQLSNGPLVGLHEKTDVPFDPTKELSRLIAERKYEEAFTVALQRSDVTIVSWLCSQVDLPGILTVSPLPLSQGVLLSLLQQLACDITKETSRKLTWMREILSALNPTDPVIAVHVRPIFEQVYQILNHHRNIPTPSGPEISNIRLIMHVINSMLMTSK